MNIDSTDYIGSLIMKNGTPDIYLFAGGYYKFISGTGIPSRTGGEGGSCYFYNYDHLGNVREVVNEEGKLEQVNNYYPFGAPFSDNAISMKNPGFQPYKYTGKELDLTHGLNTYDHGARQNYSILGVWDRVDPLAEKYYNISPYAVCGNNPLNITDINGKEFGNWEELLFVFKHPFAAYRIGSYNRGSNNISTNSVRFATRGEVLFGSKRKEDDRGSENGAFRHVLWQSTITSEYGANIAKEAGDAHEDNPNINMNQVFFTNITDADQSVDLHNNVIGRMLGNNNIGKGMRDLAIIALNYFKEEGLYEAQKVHGGYKLMRKKINDRKYNQLVNIFYQLYDNGRFQYEEERKSKSFMKRIKEATKYVH